MKIYPFLLKTNWKFTNLIFVGVQWSERSLKKLLDISNKWDFQIQFYTAFQVGFVRCVSLWSVWCTVDIVGFSAFQFAFSIYSPPISSVCFMFFFSWKSTTPRFWMSFAKFSISILFKKKHLFNQFLQTRYVPKKLSNRRM